MVNRTESNQQYHLALEGAFRRTDPPPQLLPEGLSVGGYEVDTGGEHAEYKHHLCYNLRCDSRTVSRPDYISDHVLLLK